MNIKILTQQDWEIWKSFRLEALKNSPQAFASSYKEEVHWLDLDFQNTLINNDIFGAFIDDALVCGAAFCRLTSEQTKHRGLIWGMYTRVEYRRQSIARALIKAMINHAEGQVIQIHLTCVTSNLEAVTFYQKNGFKIYATELRALRIENKFFDEYLMVLDLCTTSQSL